MLLENLSNKQIKEISKTVAPKLVKHPVFMFYCKNAKNRENFIEDFFGYFLKKWNNTEIVLTNESNDVIISLIDIERYHNKDKGIGAARLKRYKNPYANVSYHQGNVAYLTNIVAPANVTAKVMTIYSTLKFSDEVDKLVDEALELAQEKNFMIVYETFSKKSVEIMSEKGFETAYEKPFSTTQYFETVMTYYKHDNTLPVKLIEEFQPIKIHDDTIQSEETEVEYTEQTQ